MLSDIALAITEATTNAVLHAYRDRDEPGAVIDQRRVRRRVRELLRRVTREAGSPPESIARASDWGSG